MNACDPDADIENLRKLIKLNTGVTINLTRKEMENFISGRDKRDLVDIIDPTGECQRYKDRRCTCHSTVDSGYSGSVQPDEESRGILDGKFPLFTRLRKWLL